MPGRAAGTALELLLLGRPSPGINVSGDRSLLDGWAAATAF
jgi:hypothetical protein